MKFLGNEEKEIGYQNEIEVHSAPLENPEKGRWERSWPTVACGAGLFSDGYLNGYVLLPA